MCKQSFWSLTTSTMEKQLASLRQFDDTFSVILLERFIYIYVLYGPQPSRFYDHMPSSVTVAKTKQITSQITETEINVLSAVSFVLFTLSSVLAM